MPPFGSFVPDDDAHSRAAERTRRSVRRDGEGMATRLPEALVMHLLGLPKRAFEEAGRASMGLDYSFEPIGDAAMLMVGAPGGTGGLGSGVRKYDPSSLIFREEMQNNIPSVGRAFQTADEMPPIVLQRGKFGNEIIDGHNRAAVAAQRGEQVPGVTVNENVVEYLKKRGFDDDIEIAHFVLEARKQSEAASLLRRQFPGSGVGNQETKIWDALLNRSGVKRGNTLGSGSTDKRLSTALLPHATDPSVARSVDTISGVRDHMPPRSFFPTEAGYTAEAPAYAQAARLRELEELLRRRSIPGAMGVGAFGSLAPGDIQ